MGSDVAYKFQDRGEFTLPSIYCVSAMFYVQQRSLSWYMSIPSQG